MSCSTGIRNGSRWESRPLVTRRSNLRMLRKVHCSGWLKKAPEKKNEFSPGMVTGRFGGRGVKHIGHSTIQKTIKQFMLRGGTWREWIRICKFNIIADGLFE